MSENNEIMIKKHSGIIQTHVGNMTLTQRKLINYLIYIAQQTGDQKFYKTTISDVKEVCNLTSTENISVKEQLKDLAKITIEFNFLDKDKYNAWGISTLLASAVVTPNLGTVEFEFSNLLKGRILNPSMYAPLNIILVAGLKCSYSVILYEFLRDYLTAPSIPMLTIENFRNLLGVDKDKYKSFPDFRKKVLNPATEEVNLKTDICCRFELIKEAGVRNKYSHIRFFISKKTGNLTYEKNEDVKKEDLDLSMDLFEESTVAINKNIVQIPEDILLAVPDSQKTEAIKGLLIRFLEKGNEYIISNIKYTIKNAPEKFSAYLNKALVNDYACHDREFETKGKEAAIKKRRQAEQEEKAKQTSRNDNTKILKIIEHMEPDKLKELQNKFKEIVKTSGIKKEFLIESVKDSLMIEAYKALNIADGYNAKDQD